MAAQDERKLKDPVTPNMYTQVPDHEIFVQTYGGPDEILYPNDKVTAVECSRSKFNLPQQAELDSYVAEMKLASGRIVANQADQLVALTKTKLDGSTPKIAFRTTYTLKGFVSPGTPDEGDRLINEIPEYTFEAIGAWQPYDWKRAPFAIAIGDLDRARDKFGNYHDEVVIVHEHDDASRSPAGQVHIRILDYAANPGTVTETVSVLPYDDDHVWNRLDISELAPGPAYLDVTLMRDPDSGRQRIVTAHRGRWQAEDGSSGYHLGTVLNVLEYTPPGNGERTGRVAVLATKRVGGQMQISLASGNFWGLGSEGFALAGWWSQLNNHYVDVTAFSFDPDKDKPIRRHGNYRIRTETSGAQGPNTRIRLVSGLFHFDPAAGFDLPRRQLAVATSPAGKSVRIWTLAVDDDGAISELKKSAPIDVTDPSQFDLVAGDFAGVKAPTPDPAWGLAVGFPGQGGLTVTILSSSFDRTPVTYKPGGTRKMALCALDVDGDSVYLGAPVYFEVTNSTVPTTIIQQPPQHIDFLGGKIENISASPGFKVSFNQQDSSSVSWSEKHAFSQDYGASAALSGEATFKVGNLIAKDELTIGGKIAASGGWSGKNTDTEEVQTTVTYSLTANADNDDAIWTTLRSFRIWRYRVYGLKSNSDANPFLFFEVYVPGKLTLPAPAAPGRNVASYQPLHENGNILSYPDLDPQKGGRWEPADLGEWSIVDPEHPTEVKTFKTPLTTPTLISVGGTSSTQTVKLDKRISEGASFDSNGRLNVDADIHVSNKVGASVPFVAKAEEQTDFSFEPSGKWSWANLVTTQNQTARSTALSITGISAGGKTDYGYAPMLYVSTSGALKLVFAAKPKGTWWTDKYKLPDPALNLPGKFDFKGGKWSLNLDPVSALKIRGFFVRSGDTGLIDPETGLGPILAIPPHKNESVQLSVRVYNYSVPTAQHGGTADEIDVRFDAAIFDAETRTSETRKALATVRAFFTDERASSEAPASKETKFPPRGVGRAVLTIPVKDIIEKLDLDGDSGLATVTIFVVIDPKGKFAGKETHGWRSPNVLLAAPRLNTYPSAQGSILSVDILDEDGNLLEKIEGSQGTEDAIVQIEKGLRSFFESAKNPFEPENGVDMTMGDSGGIQTIVLSLPAGVAKLPDPEEFRATLTDGIHRLHFKTEVEEQIGSSVWMAASNFLLGQNNEGYGLLKINLAESR